jgi:uroporphyrinogen decarboxylase
MNIKNDLLLKAARGEKVERVPVWTMRQAGRILKEYRAVRESAGNFINLVKNPQLAAEVTIQPVDILGVDAAIIFSDILVIPEAMGLPYEMVEKTGPIFPKTIETIADVNNLRVSDAYTDLAYVLDAIKLTKKELAGRVPLIGFTGAPFTLFCYMIEGRGSKTFSKAKKMLFTDSVLSHTLLQKITDSIIDYVKAQVVSGADLIQIFDSWAGVLSPEHYRIYSLPYISQICDAIDNVPVTVFAKGAFFARKEMADLNCDVIGLDWNMDIAESRALVGTNKTLQGNLDPCVLYASFSEIERQTKLMLDQFGMQRTIANLGHGVYPDTDPEKLKCFIEAVKAY